MKIKINPRKIKKISIYAVFGVVSELLREYALTSEQYGKSSIVFEVLMIIFALLIGWNIINPEEKKDSRRDNFFVRTFRRIFKPVINKISDERKAKRVFIKGNDEVEHIRRYTMFWGRKRQECRREKIDLIKCRSDSEKIRLLYVKLILKLISKGKVVKYSETPLEIMQKHSTVESKSIFDIYISIRYYKHSIKSNDINLLCNIIDNI